MDKNSEETIPNIKINVYLVKKSFNDKIEKIVNTKDCSEPVPIPITGCSFSQLYIRQSQPKYPGWVNDLFEEYKSSMKIKKTVSLSALLLLKIGGQYFALSFGPSGRFILFDDCYEERFGLVVTLNSCREDSFRSIDKDSLDSILSHTRVQSIQETSADRFGLDVEQDMLRSIVGIPQEYELGSRMGGNDSLSVSVRVELKDLPELLKIYYKKFKDKKYEEMYEWVNYVYPVKSKKLCSILDIAIQEKLSNENYQGMWLSVPEIIPWEIVDGFVYSKDKNKQIHSDINLPDFIKIISISGVLPTIESIQSTSVYCVDQDHNKVYKGWKIYKCLYCEVEYKGEMFILNSGSWFKVENNFVKETDRKFRSIEYVDLGFPEYVGGTEEEYNKLVVKEGMGDCSLMDGPKKRIDHGGGHGKIEFCDIYTKNKEIIHVKKYGQSSVLSHLFSQGLVSGWLFQSDSSFRVKVLKKLGSEFHNTIPTSKKPENEEFCVVFAIISDSEEEKVYMPFFSRVNLNNAIKDLKGYGYQVKVAKIPVNERFSITKHGKKPKK